MLAEVSDDDRVLLLETFPSKDVLELAARLDRGLVVVLAGDDASTLRPFFRDAANIMVSPGDRDHIPWQDGFFTLVLGAGADVSPEVRRVLSPGGRVA